MSFPRKVVTPAKAGTGIHTTATVLDSCFHRNDKLFYALVKRAKSSIYVCIFFSNHAMAISGFLYFFAFGLGGISLYQSCSTRSGGNILAAKRSRSSLQTL